MYAWGGTVISGDSDEAEDDEDDEDDEDEDEHYFTSGTCRGGPGS